MRFRIYTEFVSVFFCLRYWAIILRWLIHHLFLIVNKKSLIVLFSCYLFWKYEKNWKVHVRMLWGLFRKSFHLIRLDAQKFRKESHTVNFRSSHRIRILLWSDNKTEEGLNYKSTHIFCSKQYFFCYILGHSQVQVISIQLKKRAWRCRKIP